jgi:hypothetical protein
MRTIEVQSYHDDIQERRRIQRTLNRLYWIFMYTALLFVAYGIGWWQGFTAP